ncbi:MAG: hypothetical protein R2828_19680 [Saprospiraceae bacterium]
MKIDLKAFAAGFAAALLTAMLVLIGSRELQNFDPALIGYLFGTLFAVFGIVYRYTVWIQRPPTRLYLTRSLQFVFSRRGISNLFFTGREFVQNIALQRFIYKREPSRWLAHFSLAVGCTMAFAITIPLTFGWIHFTLDPVSGLDPQTPNIYIAHFFGFQVASFELGTILATTIFHALNYCSLAVIGGCIYFIAKRFTHGGMIATQTFENDLLPLLLLVIVSVTGLALTLDYQFMKGIGFDFMAVTHAVSVILFLIWIPFGKFFHIIQRPAQIGAHIYKKEGMKRGQAACPETGQTFTTALHVDDLKELTEELGYNFDRPDGKSHLDYSPEGKRNLLAKAHNQARKASGTYFG